jgi:hypothetical protein
VIADVLRRSFIELWIAPVLLELERAIADDGDPEGILAPALEDLRRVNAARLAGQHDDATIGALGEEPDLDEHSFFSRGAVMSLLQAAIEQRIELTHRAKIVTEFSLSLPGVTTRRLHANLFDVFEPADFHWVAVVALAKALSMYRGKHDFNPTPATSIDLADDARIVIVGDWGSGLRRAQAVAGYMQDWIQDGIDAGRQVHALHLGDVYYAGFPQEYTDRFLQYWPVKPEWADRVHSWSLNGNHDMYSGGHGYFTTLLAEDSRFANQQRSSWFRIQNDHWRIVGLDTAWDEEGLIHDDRNERGLVAPQAERLNEWAAEDDRPFLLLSHHPLFSAFKEKPGTFLPTQLAPLLRNDRVRAWFWGHEHKCIIYEDASESYGVRYARCVGHGGVPVYAVRRPPEEVPRDPMKPHIEWIEQSYVQEGIQRWAYFGFAVLDFRGPLITVRYLNQYGKEVQIETISAR